MSDWKTYNCRYRGEIRVNRRRQFFSLWTADGARVIGVDDWSMC